MKQILSLIFSFLLCLSLGACGGTPPRESVTVLEDGTKITSAQDENGTLVSELVENTDGSTIAFVYHGDGSYTETATDSDGSVRTFQYDADGIRISETGDLADGTHYEIFFDPEGNILSDSSTQPSGYDYSSVYDSDGNLIEETFLSPDGTSSVRTYDANESKQREEPVPHAVCLLLSAQSRISISLPQQKGTTSPALTWTVLLQVTQ